jgi:hypothetical protein
MKNGGTDLGWQDVPAHAVITNQAAPEGEAYVCWFQNQVWCFGYGSQT